MTRGREESAVVAPEPPRPPDKERGIGGPLAIFDALGEDVDLLLDLRAASELLLELVDAIGAAVEPFPELLDLGLQVVNALVRLDEVVGDGDAESGHGVGVVRGGASASVGGARSYRTAAPPMVLCIRVHRGRITPRQTYATRRTQRPGAGRYRAMWFTACYSLYVQGPSTACTNSLLLPCRTANDDT